MSKRKKSKKGVERRRQAKIMKGKGKAKSRPKARPIDPRPIEPDFSPPDVDMPEDLVDPSPFAGMGPGGLMGPAKAMMVYSQPIMDMLDRDDLDELNQAMDIAMGFYNGLLAFNRSERETTIADVGRKYKSLRWAKMPFDELYDLMLRRHIYYFPEQHDVEDLKLYSKEELTAAAGLGEGEKELPAEDYEVPSFSPEHIQGAMTEEDKAEMERRRSRMEELRRLIEGEEEEDDLLDEEYEENEEEYADACMDYHVTVINHFARCLDAGGVKSQAIDVHCTNIDQLLNHFLVDYTGNTLMTASPDEVEGFILDFFFRKVTVSPAGEDYLIDSIVGFYRFLEAGGYILDNKPFVRRIFRCDPRYERLLKVSRGE